MTEHPPDASDPSPLDYAPPRPAFNKRQFWAGLTVSLLVCGACFVLLFFAGAYYFELHDPTDKPPHWAWLAMGVAGAALAGLAYGAVRTQRRRGGRGLLLGVVLGMGLSALPLGICFYSVGAMSAQ